MVDETQAHAKRLFVALRFSSDEGDELMARQERILAQLATGTPTRRDNLHLTLCYVGSCDARQERAACEALDQAVTTWSRQVEDARRGIELTLGRIDAFERRRDSIVWCGLLGDTPHELALLRADVARELDARGLPFGSETFTPHVTLVRGARATTDQQRLSAQRTAFTTHHDEVTLMWSHHPAGGLLTYTPIHAVALGTPGMSPERQERAGAHRDPLRYSSASDH